MRNYFNVSRLLILIIFCVGILAPIHAQDTPVITSETPASIELATSDSMVIVEYHAAEDQRVILQAMSDVAHPDLRILKDGVEIAKYRAPESTTANITFHAYLTAGTYTIQVRALNEFSTPARVFVGVLGQGPVVTEHLPYGQTVAGTILSDSPVLLYEFNGVFEPSQVIINFTPLGADVHIKQLASDETWLKLSSESIGGRLYLPPVDGIYQVVVVSNQIQPVSYTICYVSAFADCNASTPAPQATATPSVALGNCTATPINPGGANIRQSATTASPIIGALAGGQSVPVIGIDPSGTWYQVVFNTQIGWSSLTAVVGEGDCAGLPPIVPPPVATAPPTAVIPPDTAVPSITPLSPTETSISATATPPPPGATATATATPGIGLTFLPPLTLIPMTFVPLPSSTPPPLLTFLPPPLTLVFPITCTVTFTGPEYVYTYPNADISNLLHQMSGGESYTVLGRYSGDASWYKINYYNGWWRNVSGANATLSGNCGMLPSLSAP